MRATSVVVGYRECDGDTLSTADGVQYRGIIMIDVLKGIVMIDALKGIILTDLGGYLEYLKVYMKRNFQL